jgi:hypothetical protein
MVFNFYELSGNRARNHIEGVELEDRQEARSYAYDLSADWNNKVKVFEEGSEDYEIYGSHVPKTVEQKVEDNIQKMIREKNQAERKAMQQAKNWKG